MISFRPFRNCDPPALAEIWHSHPPLRGLVQYVSPAQLERHVFSKPYFDREGLILAIDGERPVGFVHAGFAGAVDGTTIDPARGVVSLLLVAPRKDREEIAAELLVRGEEYLRRRGARSSLAGGAPGADPFYLGLCGGSEIGGILQSDETSLARLRNAGYDEWGRKLVLHRRLVGFRAPVDRQQMKIRRNYNVVSHDDPTPGEWWGACVWGETLRTSYNVQERNQSGVQGEIFAWDMQPLASGWGVHAAGLVGLRVDPDARGQGVATFVLGEAIRRLQSQRVTLVEVQVDQSNEPARGLFSKLGFEPADEAVMLSKVLSR